MDLSRLVEAAQAGNVEAYGVLVESTQAMAYAVAVGVLRDPAVAQDAVQQAYLRAFRRLSDLQDPAAFAGWFRRVVITVALNMRRAKRVTLLRLDDIPESEFFIPPLTTFRQEFGEVGRLALRMLVSQVEGQRPPRISSTRS